MSDLAHVETRLRSILAPYRERLETYEIYGVEMLRRPGAKKHDWFAGVQAGKDAVKFSLLPMHGHPELLDGISAGLWKAKGGASFFAFSTVDESLMDELESLVAKAFVAYMAGRTG